MATTFEDELEVFRTEEEVAQQYFFAYLSVRALALKDKDVLANMNTNPLFWKTTHHAMVLAAFMAIGRIFDQDRLSDHNIDKLMTATADNLHLFTKAELAKRKIAAGLTQEQADKYVSDRYELTLPDIRDLKKQVAKWRRVYDERYRDVRHQAFAHKRKRETVEAVMAKTNIDEIKEMLGFFAGLQTALEQLWLNGRQPIVTVRQFTLPPEVRLSTNNWSPGERVFFEGHEVLRMVTPPDPDELRYNAGMMV